MQHDSWDSDFNKPRPQNTYATTGAILGILGFILCWIPFLGIFIGHILGALAIIFSAIGLSRASKFHIGYTTATIGLIFGIITFILKSIPIINLI